MHFASNLGMLFKKNEGDYPLINLIGKNEKDQNRFCDLWF